jgi:hypothetical protein
MMPEEFLNEIRKGEEELKQAEKNRGGLYKPEIIE